MANINQVQLPDGSQYNLIDDTSGYASQTYVQNAIASVNKNTIGLGNVDNTSDLNKPVSTAQQTALDGKTDTSMVAEIQTTLTANKRYSVGDEFIYQGVLYKATAIIPNSDPIVIGTNATLADRITEQIKPIKDAVDNITRSKRVLYFVDSYNGVVEGVKWTDIIDNAFGFSNSVICGGGGKGFIASAGTWLQDLQALTIDDDSTITDIIIVGGANDSFRTISDIIPAMTTFDTYVKTRFTNLKNVYIGFAGNSFYTSTQSNNMRLAANAYIEGAKRLNWIYLNGIEQTLYNPNLMQYISPNDMIHPNENGVKALGRNAVACLNSGSCNNRHGSWNTVITTDTGHFVEKTFNITECITGNLLTISWGDISIQTNASTQGYLKLGSCPTLKNAILPNVIMPIIIIFNNTPYFNAIVFESNGTDLYIGISPSIPSGEYFSLRSATHTFDLSKF